MKNLKVVVFSVVLLMCTQFSFASDCYDFTCLGKTVTIVCDGSKDYCIGTDENDVIYVSGNGLVFAKGGNDTICVEATEAKVRGGNGNDVIVLINGGGEHWGNMGNDILVNRGTLPAILRGGFGDDNLVSLASDNTLNGGPDVDRCVSVSQSSLFLNCE